MRSPDLRPAVVTLTTMVVLAGCTSNDPTADPTSELTTETETQSPTGADTTTPTQVETTDPEAEARAEIEAVFDAYVEGFTAAMAAGPTPPVLVEHLDGVATGSWIIELQNGFGATPPPVEKPPAHGVVTITDLDLEAGTASGTSCYGPVRVDDSRRHVIKQVEWVRQDDGTWLVSSDRADGETSCDA